MVGFRPPMFSSERRKAVVTDLVQSSGRIGMQPVLKEGQELTEVATFGQIGVGGTAGRLDDQILLEPVCKTCPLHGQSIRPLGGTGTSLNG